MAQVPEAVDHGCMWGSVDRGHHGRKHVAEEICVLHSGLEQREVGKVPGPL